MSLGRILCSRIFSYVLTIIITFTFVFYPLTPSRYVFAREAAILGLPVPGTQLRTSESYEPALVKGITIYPDKPLQFNFIVHPGDDRLKGEALQQESLKMIKYFLATLTIPKDEMWVNLSPYEKDRIIPENLGITEIGRDMLAQDYLLKQLTASLIYPEESLGRRFWDRVYNKVYKEFGLKEVPINTFNKVWIVPDKAVVYEHDNTAFVIDQHLKVMLEEDYLALQESRGSDVFRKKKMDEKEISGINHVSSEILRTIIIPEIEKEVNSGRTFADLRQIYNAMILGIWYKQTLKNSLLASVYADQNKIVGVDVDDKEIKEKIYRLYIEAYGKGVFNYIREDTDPQTQDVIPRKYFSGGLVAPAQVTVKNDFAQLNTAERRNVRTIVSSPIQHQGIIVKTLELSRPDAEARILDMLRQALLKDEGRTFSVLQDVADLLSRDDMRTIPDIRAALEPFRGRYFYDLAYGYQKDSLVLERGAELWLVVDAAKREGDRLYRYIKARDSVKEEGDKDIREIMDFPESHWQIVRVRKGDLEQDKLIDLQLIEDHDFRVIDLVEEGRDLREDDIGQGIEGARDRIIGELDYQDYLQSFVSRLQGKTIMDESGRTIPLFVNEKIRTGEDLLTAFEQARPFLDQFDESDPMEDVYARLRDVGLERGWGDTLSEMKTRLDLLLESAGAADSVSRKSLLMELDDLTPTALSAVFVSTHGWFVQENAFGKPDTGGQVSFVRDEAKAMAKEIAGKMERAGIPGKAVALIFTRLIPKAEDTTADLPEESVYEDDRQVVKLVRVPFEDQERSGEVRGRPQPKNILEVIQAFIRRFEIWSYITQEEFINTAGARITEVMNRYGQEGPDIIMGNYSDGNLLAGKLSDYYGGNVPVVMTAHALELSKYFKSMLENGRLIDNWFETEDGRYLAAQALIDAWVMRKADIIETSTLLEILGQYSYYESFEFENLFRVDNGIKLTDGKFVLNEPSVDQRTVTNPDGLFFAYEGPDDVRRQEFADANALWQAKIFAAPDGKNKVYDRFADWKDSSKPVVFTMARFDSRKNIAGLVEEFAKAGLKDRANLVIVGGNTDYIIDGDGKVVFKSQDGSDDMNAEELAIAEKILALVEQYGLDGHIRWISASTIARESAELYRVMEAHPQGAIFAQPAIFEAFGLTILEAMVTKLMVVATDQGGPAEIIRHHQDGFLANPEIPGEFGERLGEALDALANAEQKQAIIHSALERIASKYSWRRRVQRTLQATKLFSTLNDVDRNQRPDHWQARKQSQEKVYRDILDMIDNLVWVHKLDLIPPEAQPEMENLIGEQFRTGAEAVSSPLAQDAETDAGSYYGGIDLNSDMLDLQIKRDGRGVALPLPQQPIQNMTIQGFMPIIIDVVPVNVPLLLGTLESSSDNMPSDDET